MHAIVILSVKRLKAIFGVDDDDDDDHHDYGTLLLGYENVQKRVNSMLPLPPLLCYF